MISTTLSPTKQCPNPFTITHHIQHLDLKCLEGWSMIYAGRMGGNEDVEMKMCFLLCFLTTLQTTTNVLMYILIRALITHCMNQQHDVTRLWIIDPIWAVDWNVVMGNNGGEGRWVGKIDWQYSNYAQYHPVVNISTASYSMMVFISNHVEERWGGVERSDYLRQNKHWGGGDLNIDAPLLYLHR